MIKAWITKQRKMSGLAERIHLSEPNPENYETIIEGVFLPKEEYERLLKLEKENNERRRDERT